jgi:hypothetical protein
MGLMLIEICFGSSIQTSAARRTGQSTAKMMGERGCPLDHVDVRQVLFGLLVDRLAYLEPLMIERAAEPPLSEECVVRHADRG